MNLQLWLVRLVEFGDAWTPTVMAKSLGRRHSTANREPVIRGEKG
jgi:hypothetical protein